MICTKGVKSKVNGLASKLTVHWDSTGRSKRLGRETVFLVYQTVRIAFYLGFANAGSLESGKRAIPTPTYKINPNRIKERPDKTLTLSYKNGRSKILKMAYLRNRTVKKWRV